MEQNIITFEELSHIEEIPLITMKDVFCGSVTGLVQTITGHPFDVIKINQQTNKENIKILDSIRSVYNKENKISSFYKGISSPLFFLSYSVMLQFIGFNLYKRYVCRNKYNNDLTKLTVKDLMFAGTFSGFFASIINCPMDYLKIRVQNKCNIIEKSTSTPYKLFKSIFLSEGIFGIYNGFSISLFYEMLGNTFYFGVYESLIYRENKLYNSSRNDIASFKIMIFGALAGMNTWLICYPFDVIKSRIQSNDLSFYTNNEKNTDNVLKKSDKSILSLNSKYKDACKLIYKEKGIKGFFNGIVICQIRAMCVNSLGFLAYEKALKFCDNKYC